MSLILKGIDPKTDYGLCMLTKSGELITANGKHIQAIQIPKNHGRLIDGNKLRATLRRWTEDEWNQKASPVSWACAYEDIIDLIDDEPTILEAEEEDGKVKNRNE